MSPDASVQQVEFQRVFDVRAGRTVLGSFSVRLPGAPEGGGAGLRAGPSGALHSALVLHYKSDVAGWLETWAETPDRSRSSHAKKQAIADTAGQERVVEIPLPDYPEQRIVITLDRRSGAGTFQIVQSYVMSDLADEDRLIRILSRGANHTDLEVGPLPGPRILTCLDAYYPGWRVEVDGGEAPLLRVHEAFKGVYLPEGTHRVRFAFAPKLTYAAVGISVAAALAACAAALALRLGARDAA